MNPQAGSNTLKLSMARRLSIMAVFYPQSRLSARTAVNIDVNTNANFQIGFDANVTYNASTCFKARRHASVLCHQLWSNGACNEMTGGSPWRLRPRQARPF
ncbi:hypothetical protein SODG_002685 [Sodalis praecaptivus]